MAVKDPNFDFERHVSGLQPGYLIAGLDEVGRGAIAGPVTMGCTILPVHVFDEEEPYFPTGVRDSKLLSEKKRNGLVDPIKEWSEAYGVAHSSSEIIDNLGIMGGLYLAGWSALTKAVNNLAETPNGIVIIIDGPNNLLKWKHPSASEFIPDFGFEIIAYPKVKADMDCVSVACGSVLAKVERDAIMTELHNADPQYHWDKNKGYGSPNHLQAIKESGVNENHRKSYKIFS